MSMKSVSIPTLKGVFPEPKVQPKRDFLRENKIKVRNSREVNNVKKNPNGLAATNASKYLNGHKHVDVKKTICVPKRVKSGCSCGSQISPCMDAADSISQKSTTSVSNKEIQTDDISDEHFLYTHLKRCSSMSLPQVGGELSARSNQDYEYNEDNAGYEEEQHQGMVSNRSSQNIATVRSNQYVPPTRSNQNIVSARSNQNMASNRSNQNIVSARSNQNMTSNRSNHNINHADAIDALSDDIGVLAIDNVSSHDSKLYSGKRDGLSSKRSEVRLPKYLEREKREKEQDLEKERERERFQDPNCPEGHRALTDEERHEALATAKQQFQNLVNELNHMPMTSETLRTRTRKNEIEKSLVELEADIRILSKAKVYTSVG